MRNRLNEARALVPAVAAQLFEGAPGIRSVGVGLVGQDYGFVVEERADTARPLCAQAAPRATTPPVELFGFPVRRQLAYRAPAPLPWHRNSLQGLALQRQPEQARVRPLVGGLEVQNLDADLRAGVLSHGGYVGTLGCMVRLADGSPGMLSNAHVLADCGRGQCGHDRIMQAGGCRFFSAPEHVAVLEASLPLVAEPPGVTHFGGLTLNTGDAAVARLLPGMAHIPGYLPMRGVPAPVGTAMPVPGDAVFKVGRTTGLTRGVVDRVGLVDSVPYPHGLCWFEEVFSVRADGDDEFADDGDSGSAVLRSDGTVLGLLFASASNGVLCCEIEALLGGLGCVLM